MAFKVFTAGSVLTAADLNDYLMEQAVIVCTSGTRPTGQDGMRIKETDTGRELMHDGVGWTIMSEPAQSHTMTIGSTIGSITTVGTKSFSYRRHDGRLTFEASIAITTNGTGSGAVTLTLPVAPLSASTAIGAGRETSSTGKTLSVTTASSGSVAHVVDYSNAYPAASGYTLKLWGQYPMTTRYS